MVGPFNAANPRRDAICPPLAEKTVSIVGLGGGSEIAFHLLRSGVGAFHLFDFDTLEAGNLIRHACGIEQVGKNKAVAVAESFARHCGGDGGFFAHPIDVFREREPFERHVADSDLVIVATDTDASRFYVGEIAAEHGVPALFVSMFERGAGGEVFAAVPKGACYECFVRHQGRREFIEAYVASREKTDCSSSRDAKTMPGLGVDQGMVSAIAARKALDILLLGSEHSLPPIGPNWIVFSVSGIPNIVESPLSSLSSELFAHPDCPHCG